MKPRSGNRRSARHVNDRVLCTGASYWVKLAESWLRKG
jgi:hypothetical protein